MNSISQHQQQIPSAVKFGPTTNPITATAYFQQQQHYLLQQQQQIELERIRQVQQQAAYQQQRALLHQQMMYYEQELQQQQQQLDFAFDEVPDLDFMNDNPNATTVNMNYHDCQMNDLTFHASNSSPPSSENKAQRRAEHNAIERARRESLNTKFQQLAHSLPNLQNDRRPSKGTIIERTLEYVKQTVQKEERFQNEIEQLRQANESLISKITTDIIYEDDEEEEEEELNTPINSSHEEEEDEEDEEDEEKEEGEEQKGDHFISRSSMTSMNSSIKQYYSSQQDFQVYNKYSSPNNQDGPNTLLLNNQETFIHF